jgi:hypothetical protein
MKEEERRIESYLSPLDVEILKTRVTAGVMSMLGDMCMGVAVRPKTAIMVIEEAFSDALGEKG